jgi:hypothetical protein
MIVKIISFWTLKNEKGPDILMRKVFKYASKSGFFRLKQTTGIGWKGNCPHCHV